MRHKLASLFGAFSLVASAGAQADVVNGGFENGLAGWSVSGFVLSGFDYGIDSQAQAGQNGFYGGAVGSFGYLSQSIATSIGQTYNVSFWLAGDGYVPNQLQVLADGSVLYQTQDTLLQSYRAETTSFVASSTLTTLSFGLRDDFGVLHLDSIAVTPVPEPATWLLTALGLAAVVGRRMKKTI